MDSYQIASALEVFAKEQGFVPPPAHYILGEFNLTAPDGTSLYTDEAHLWCEACAEALVAKALPLLPEAEREEHPIYRTDADSEDSCPHCRACGETLTGSISDYAIEEEIAHYSEHPINPSDTINPRQAVEISQLLWAAPSDERALKIGQAALEAIRTTSKTSGTSAIRQRGESDNPATRDIMSADHDGGNNDAAFQPTGRAAEESAASGNRAIAGSREGRGPVGHSGLVSGGRSGIDDEPSDLGLGASVRGLVGQPPSSRNALDKERG